MATTDHKKNSSAQNTEKANPSAKPGMADKGEAGPSPDSSFNPDYPGSWIEAAKQTLDLWQQQLSGNLADPYWVDQWGYFLNNLQRAVAQRDAQNPKAAAPDPKQHSKAADHEQSPAKPQAADLSSEQRLGDVDELAKRLHDLEKRVAVLERQNGSAASQGTPKSSKRSS